VTGQQNATRSGNATPGDHKKPRTLGPFAGEFRVPDDFDGPLLDATLDAFDRLISDEA
jgi:hypothetical protein